MLVWSAATFGSGLAPTYLALVVARALTGVGEASYTVVTPSLVSDFYPAARRGRALAIFYAAIPVGSALGYVLGGAINARFGWRWAFFMAGMPGMALALPLLFLRDPQRGALDARGNAQAPPARPSLRVLAALPELPLQHGRPDHLHVRRRAGWRPGCRPTSCASATCRSSRPT